MPLEAAAEISDELSPSWVDNSQICDTFQKQAKVFNKDNKTDFWLSDAGQTELLRRLDVDSNRHSSNGLSVFDYTAESKAML